MNKKHWVINLLTTAPPLEAADSEVSSILKRLGSDASGGISLPNSSLCADFLYSKSRGGIIGITVAVANSDADYVKRLFTSCEPTRVRWAKTSRSFIEYRDCIWLEVSWAEYEGLELLETQSDGVEWYLSSTDSQKICAVVLWRVDYLEKECEMPFIK